MVGVPVEPIVVVVLVKMEAVEPWQSVWSDEGAIALEDGQVGVEAVLTIFPEAGVVIVTLVAPVLERTIVCEL